MGNFRTIWKHEVAQTDQIVKILLDNKKVAVDWKIMLVPVFLYKVYHYRKDLSFTRKNFLFTKQLAYDAAKNIFQGKEQAWEFRRIEIQTKEILDKEKKGFYTEKIRRKQLPEIDLLIKHYLELFNAKQSKYPEIIKEIYLSKGKYLAFLSTLQKAEEDVRHHHHAQGDQKGPPGMVPKSKRDHQTSPHGGSRKSFCRPVNELNVNQNKPAS
jgi:hypothetical protein